MYEITAHIRAVKRRLTILGSTGSVGRQALEVVRAHPDLFDVVGLSANTDADTLRRQAAEFEPELVALESPDVPSADGFGCELLAGPGASEHLAREPVDVVLNGIVGFAGLAATVGASKPATASRWPTRSPSSPGASGSRASPAPTASSPWTRSTRLSSSAWKGRGEVSGVLLTASGGPFFSLEKARLLEVGPEDALDHPTWRMGPKITVDSATMMNKGLEVIEAHHLFDVPYDDVRVAVHRQSVVHGGVLFEDGSVVLHAALPDMRLPIAYGLLCPERVDVGARPVPFDGSSWTFEEPRDDLFRCLPLAVEAGRPAAPTPWCSTRPTRWPSRPFSSGGSGSCR